MRANAQLAPFKAGVLLWANSYFFRRDWALANVETPVSVEHICLGVQNHGC
jgi:hypothetical protein